MPYRELGVLAVVIGLCPVEPAIADVTADDVWNNSTALIEALGGTHEAALARNGDRVLVQGHEIVFDLPVVDGRVTLGLSDYEMIEADGAVTVFYPAGLEVTARAMIPQEQTISAALRLGAAPISTLATGVPGAISYVTRTGPLSFDLVGLDLPGEPEVQASFRLDMEGYAAESRIVEDTLIVVYSSAEIGRITSRSEFNDGQGFETWTETESGEVSSTINMGLIPGGADLMNLSSALRDGMYVTAESSSGRSTSRSWTTLDGQSFQDQFYSTEGSSGSFGLDRTHLAFGVDVGPGLFEMADEMMTPAAFGVDFQGFGLHMAGPILRSAEPQPFRLDLGVDDLRLGPTIWALFDPDKALPRGPGSIELSVSGEALLDADLPDFLALPELGGRRDASVRVTQVDIARFGLSALGVTADSSGTFELDYEDHSVLPGLPWPAGQARAEIRGLNALVDALIDEGLIGREEALGLRLIISMGTIVAGDDVLNSEIEFTEDGRFIANGQPINLP